jgi:hypothetical protein
MGCDVGHRASAVALIADDPADARPDEVGNQPVGRLADQGIADRADEAGATGLPVLLENGGELLVGQLCAGFHRRPAGLRRDLQIAESRPLTELVQFPVTAVMGFEAGDEVGIEGRVPGRHAEVGGALKDRQVGGRLGDHRNGLYGRGAGADDADPLAGEVDRTVRPQAGLVTFAAKVFQARQIGYLRHRQASGGHDAVACPRNIAGFGAHLPEVGIGLVGRRSRGGRNGCRRAARNVRRRGARSRGSPAGWRSARSTASPARVPARTSRNRPGSRRRSGRRDSGSSTTCRRRRHRLRRPAPAAPGHAGDAADTGRRNRRRRRWRRTRRHDRRLVPIRSKCVYSCRGRVPGSMPIANPGRVPAGFESGTPAWV